MQQDFSGEDARATETDAGVRKEKVTARTALRTQ
jgi:hypothetical protein